MDANTVLDKTFYVPEKSLTASMFYVGEFIQLFRDRPQLGEPKKKSCNEKGKKEVPSQAMGIKQNHGS